MDAVAHSRVQRDTECTVRVGWCSDVSGTPNITNLLRIAHHEPDHSLVVKSEQLGIEQ